MSVLGFYSQAALLFVACFCLAYARIARAISYSGDVPRVGKSGVLGYVQTAIRWTLDSEAVILEGRKAFSGKAFVIPTLSGPCFFLPPKFLERVRAGPDSKFNEMMAVNEDLQLPYTMDEHQLSTPYQARVLRTDVNRAIPSYVSEILDESILAMGELFNSKNSKSCELEVFDSMTQLIARISNRVVFGTELCRNKQFLHVVVKFAETTPLMAPFIQWSPLILRPVVYHILASILGGKRAPLKFILPFLNRRIHELQTGEAKSNLVSDHIIQSALPQEPVIGIAVRLLNIEFGSIHTSSIFITQTLFEIALLPSEDVESMRAEINQALELEGGWCKGALDKFYKVDSALREIGRFYGLMHFALPRVALEVCDLGDGTYVPSNSKVAVDMKAIHFDPHVYPDPLKCDLFRFSKLRGKEGAESSKYGFTTVDSHYLPFGAGRHACAGRHFASMELKIMLAHILLHYDIRYPPPITERPKNIIFNGAIVPDTKAKLLFMRRNANST